jgi:hypothetical protein
MRKILLTTATLVAAAFAVFGASPSQAANAQWCAFTSSTMSTDCAYYTLAQCQAFVSGQAGSCERNIIGVRNAQAHLIAPAWRPATIDAQVPADYHLGQ